MSQFVVNCQGNGGLNPFKRASKKGERSENIKQENFSPLTQSKKDEFHRSQPHIN